MDLEEDITIKKNYGFLDAINLLKKLSKNFQVINKIKKQHSNLMLIVSSKF